MSDDWVESNLKLASSPMTTTDSKVSVGMHNRKRNARQLWKDVTIAGIKSSHLHTTDYGVVSQLAVRRLQAHVKRLGFRTFQICPNTCGLIGDKCRVDYSALLVISLLLIDGSCCSSMQRQQDGRLAVCASKQALSPQCASTQR